MKRLATASRGFEPAPDLEPAGVGQVWGTGLMKALMRAIMSVPRALMLGVWIVMTAASPTTAHNLAYALVDIGFPTNGQVRIEIRTHVPALIMGAPPSVLGDTALPRFMALTDAEIGTRQEIAAANFLGELSLRADGRLIDAVAMAFPRPAELRADALAPRSNPRPSQPVILTAVLPPGTRQVDLALPTDLGPAVLVARYADGQVITEALSDGARSRAIRPAGPDSLSDAVSGFLAFAKNGFLHILPAGFDHVLFIVALAVAAPQLRALVKMATVFTLAHSITLVLGALRMVEVPPGVVEPAISLSIAAVAVLTLMSPQAALRRERLAVIFAFGLLHGLGFAGGLHESGLPRGLEAVALAGFNIGIELGQLVVIAVVLAGFGWWRDRPFYRSRIAVPISAVVALAGTIWTVQRIIVALEPARAGGF